MMEMRIKHDGNVDKNMMEMRIKLDGNIPT